MLKVTSIGQLNSALADLRQTASTIGLVPTMGALHEGHLSLVRQCLSECPVTVVTIFVNPTQFGPTEDLEQYPRPLENDLRLLNDLGTDLVFVPPSHEIYQEGFSTFVTPPSVADSLEGERRPTHFRGVATVVLKLFNLIGADIAYFGQKDYQQSLVVRHMVRDLNIPIKIRVCPIVRDQDGLALSSRNVYLKGDERRAALSLSQALRQATQLIAAGERDGTAVMAHMRQAMIDAGVSSIDYAVVADTETLDIQETIRLPAVLLIAAHVGNTRLIDNTVVSTNSS